MRCEQKDNSLLLEAMRLSNNGHHAQAAHVYQRAGNQYRNLSEKKELWAAAERSRRIAYSD